MKKALLLLGANGRDRIFSPKVIEQLKDLVQLKDCCDITDDRKVVKEELQDAEIILSGWGCVPFDKELLEAAPELEAVFYGAGSVRGLVCDEFWERDIRLTSAWAAISFTVAEYTVALMVISMKRAVQIARQIRKDRDWSRASHYPVGMKDAAIGVIGAGKIGARVLEMLKTYDAHAYVYDPYLPQEKAQELGAIPIGLEDMFKQCDVVSLHAPKIPETKHMIRGEHFRSMKEGAVFINTARGQIVREAEMIEVLKERKIYACIDVTDPEPPSPDSPLYELDNVFLTPHVAGCGSQDNLLQGELVLEEVKRFLRGDPPLNPVTEEMMQWMA